MKEIVLEGKTAEEAIEEGLKQLGVTREQVQVEILDEGKKGMFGLGGKMARVKLTRTEDNTERAAQIARDILERMGIEAEVSGEKVEDEIVIRISGAGGVLIGRRGQTLFSFQYLLTRILNQGEKEWDKITLDVEGYRERREKEMTDLAERLYKSVLEKGREITVKNLSAHDRRIIHMLLKERPEVETHSHGKGHLRKLVVSPRNKRRRSGPPLSRRDSDGGASQRVRTFTKRFENPSNGNH